MKILYSDSTETDIGPSMFLAGPTPRSLQVKSWRPDAIQILKELDFDATVCVPEHKNPTESFDYHTQVEWEYATLSNSLHTGVIVFWIPRSFPDMPAFTTNVEFGRYVTLARRGNVFYGRPDNSEKNSYLDWLYEKIQGRRPYNDLRKTLADAVGFMNLQKRCFPFQNARRYLNDQETTGSITA